MHHRFAGEPQLRSVAAFLLQQVIIQVVDLHHVDGVQPERGGMHHQRAARVQQPTSLRRAGDPGVRAEILRPEDERLHAPAGLAKFCQVDERQSVFDEQGDGNASRRPAVFTLGRRDRLVHNADCGGVIRLGDEDTVRFAG